MKKTVKAWVQAFRPRTLPLSLSTLFLGAGLAATVQSFSVWIFIFSVLTAVFLQALSDLSNDYGDAQNMLDGKDRVGPKRTVASGQISPANMRIGIVIIICLCVVSAFFLFYFSLGNNPLEWIFFCVLLASAIWAAMFYTLGKKPYGYRARGDYYVFVYFGIISVLGSYYLYTGKFESLPLMPAIAAGLFCTSVLNINNIRDIDGDRKHGKYTIALRFGPKKARIYHVSLVVCGVLAWMIYLFLNVQPLAICLIFLTMPIVISAYKVFSIYDDAKIIDKQLRNTALGTSFFHTCMAIALPLL